MEFARNAPKSIVTEKRQSFVVVVIFLEEALSRGKFYLKLLTQHVYAYMIVKMGNCYQLR